MKRKGILVALVIAVACSISGCQKKEDNTLYVGVEQLSGVFNPLYATSIYDSYVSDLVYDSLLMSDSEGNFVPCIASELPSVSEDGLQVTYRLKEDIRFSDGTPLTSKDVAFSVNVIADPSYMGALGVRLMNVKGYDTYKAQESKQLEGMQIVDDYTIAFTFKEPFRINALEIGKIPIISEKQFKDFTYNNTSSVEKDKKFIGSGPYVLEEYEAGGAALLRKNAEYYRDGYAIENVVLKPIGTQSDYQELEKGNIDLLSECIAPTKIQSALEDKDIMENEYPRGAMGVVTFNAKGSATKDIKVRQALAYAFDREAFIASYFGCEDCKKETLAYVPATYQNPLANVSNETFASQIETYAFSIDKAKQILTEAGYVLNKDGVLSKDNKELEVIVLALQDNPYVERMIPIWQKHWQEELGIKVTIQHKDMNAISQIVMQEKNQEAWSAFFMGMYFDGTDPDSIYSMFHSSQAMDFAANISRVQDPTLDALLEEARFEKEENAMVNKYIAVAKRVNELCTALPVYTNLSYDLYSTRLQNFKTNANYGWTSALYEATLT